MDPALAVSGLVGAALAWELVRQPLRERLARIRRREAAQPPTYDPGRELRAQRRAERLLRSCVDAEAWAMYRELGFIRVWGGLAGTGRAAPAAEYAYLIYPHKPIVAFLPQTGAVIAEYCVTFPRQDLPTPLPAGDDVLAKWLLLRADERALLGQANLHLPGTQHDPARLQADLRRLRAFDRSWAARPQPTGGEGSVPGGEPTAV